MLPTSATSFTSTTSTTSTTPATPVVAAPVTAGGAGPATVQASGAERAWVTIHTAAFAGAGTVLGFSMRPVLSATCIAAAANFLGEDPAHPSALARALGTAVSDGLIAPVVIGAGATAAELAGRTVKRLFTLADVVGDPNISPDYLHDVGLHIGTGFSIMSFALAYQAAMDDPRTTAGEVFMPSALGGGITGAVAVGAALLGPLWRQLQACAQGKSLVGHHLTVQGTEQEGNCGARLVERLRSLGSAANLNAIGGFFDTRVRAAAEMNREMVFGLIPVIEAQMILSMMQPSLNPADGNVLGLHDLEGFSAHQQYAVLMAGLTMLIHTNRVNGWTNRLTGFPVPKLDMNSMTLPHLAKSCGAAAVNLTTACISAYLTRQMVLAGEGQSIAQAASDSDYFGFDGEIHVMDLVAGLMCGALLLRSIGSGVIDDVFRLREMTASVGAGLVAGTMSHVDGVGSLMAGLALSTAAHALAQPTFARPDLSTSEGWARQLSVGIFGLASAGGHLVIDPIAALASRLPLAALYSSLQRGLRSCGAASGLPAAQQHAEQSRRASQDVQNDIEMQVDHSGREEQAPLGESEEKRSMSFVSMPISQWDLHVDIPASPGNLVPSARVPSDALPDITYFEDRDRVPMRMYPVASSSTDTSSSSSSSPHTSSSSSSSSSFSPEAAGGRNTSSSSSSPSSLNSMSMNSPVSQTELLTPVRRPVPSGQRLVFRVAPESKTPGKGNGER